MGAPKEIELKLEIEPNDVPRIEGHAALQAAAATREIAMLNSVYFDTDDVALSRAGVTLRVRDMGGRYIQAIKAASGMFDRSEWETELPNDQPDLSKAKGTALEPLLTGDVLARLRPVFATRIRRTTYRVTQGDSLVEIALDQGEIEAGERHAAVCEVELELKRGTIADLFQLAQSVAATVPLTLNPKSKPERGYDLCQQGEASPVEKAREVTLERGMASADAFKIIGRNCLRQLLVNIPAMRERKEEGLHQMRIGLRRLRAALSLFAPLFVGDRAKQLKAELKWMTQQLGPARDLDVLIKHLSSASGKEAARQDLETLGRLKARREQAYADAVAMTRSQRFGLALLDIAAWIETGDGLSDRQCEPIADYAAGVLAKRRKRVRKKGERLDELSAKERHRLRIRAKNLRYGIEFFASLFSGKVNEERRSAALSWLKQLQDLLGELNDIAIRKTLLAEGAEQSADADAQLRQAGAECSNAHVKRLLADANHAHEQFANVKAFWTMRED